MNEMIFFYGQPFLWSFVISNVLCFIIIKFARKLPASKTRKSGRYIHKSRVSRFGGVAIIAAFIFSLFLNQYLFFDKIVWSMIIGGSMILLLGVIDDIKPLSWKSQFFSQIVIVLFVFIMGVRIELITNPLGGVMPLIYDGVPIASLIFMLIWMIIIMNAINWCDGVDGLAGGVVIIAAFTLLLISLQPNVMQPPIAIIAATLAGGVAGFMIFNFPPAQIFAGSSGSFFMGFVIALLAIAAGAKIGTTLLVLAVPLVDAIWVVVSRIYNGKSIFQGDTQHLHHKLLDRGWSSHQVITLYYVITMTSAALAIATVEVSKLIAFASFCFVILIFFTTLSYNNTKKQHAPTS